MAPPYVLLVTSDPAWLAPVREAVAAQGGVVETVSAPAAVVRLARLGVPVTHVMVDSACPEGLANTIAALTADNAGAALLFLGTPAAGHGPGQVITGRDRQPVTAALNIRRFPVARAEPELTADDLRQILEGGYLSARYQPIVRLADRAVMAVEVLARMHHPVHPGLTPDWFVHRFEETGLACAMTEQIAARAFADGTGPDLRDLGLTMALNLPLRVLTSDGATQTLDNMRAAAGLTADRIAIELTESQPVEDFPALAQALEALRALGYRVSIDDAGPEVKNLDRMLELPFSGLKLDKGVVRTLRRGEQASGPWGARLPGMIQQAAAKGMTIVAEGVESQETWDLLRDLGVAEAQGFFIARPLPAAAVPLWRAAWIGG